VPRVPSNASTAPNTADVIVDGQVTKRRPGPAPKQKAVIAADPDVVVVDLSAKPWLSDPKKKLVTEFEWDFYQSQNKMRTNPGSFISVV
jgi:hypothetical protein